MNDLELMHRLWAQAQRIQNLIDYGKKHLKKFGLRRFIFFNRFERVNKRMERYEFLRLSYVSMALSISRRINTQKRRKRLDH